MKSNDHDPQHDDGRAALLGTAAGSQTAAWMLAEARLRRQSIEAARRVAHVATHGMTDGEVLAWIAGCAGRGDLVVNTLHETLDAAAVNWLHTATGGRVPYLKLYEDTCRRALDGAYQLKGSAKWLTQACFAQHKNSASDAVHAMTAKAVDPRLGGRIEIVVPRDISVRPLTATPYRSVRQAAHSSKQLASKAARLARVSAKDLKDPSRLTKVAERGAARVSLRAGAVGAAVGATASVAFDVRKLRRGEIDGREMATNATWSAAEAGVSTVASGAAVAATASAIPAVATALSASTVVGTTAVAGALVVAGPATVALGTGIAVGAGIRAVRRRLGTSTREQPTNPDEPRVATEVDPDDTELAA